MTDALQAGNSRSLAATATYRERPADDSGGCRRGAHRPRLCGTVCAQVALERAEYKRRELAEVRPANLGESAKLLTILPNAAELYRRQISLGLDGAHPQIMLEARLALRELLGQIRLEPGENGNLWAAYEVSCHPSGCLERR